MWLVPTTASEALPYVVTAADRDGYLGLMLVLARTAEARTVHGELARDWTSIHDVTGHRIAVLCPDPEFVQPEPIQPWDYFPSDRLADRWFGLKLAQCLDLPHTRVVIPGVPVARPRGSAEAHQAAWTEAVTRCAACFGVDEARLPAVLVVCLREETSVLIQLRPETSIYRLCKRIASSPGYAPGDDERLRERARLREAVPRLRVDGGRHRWVTPDDPPRTMRRLLEVPAVRKQFDGLAKHLATVAAADPALRREWSEGLRALTESDATDRAMCEYLHEIAEAVHAHPRRGEWRNLDNKVRKVAQVIEAAAHPRDEFRFVPESAEDKAVREQRLAHAEAELAEVEEWLDSRPGLAGACVAAARAELGACEVEQISGYRPRPGRMDELALRVVRPIGPAPDAREVPVVRNELSGTVHGPAVQAGHIDHLHVHNGRRSGRLSRPWRKRRAPGE